MNKFCSPSYKEFYFARKGLKKVFMKEDACDLGPDA